MLLFDAFYEVQGCNAAIFQWAEIISGGVYFLFLKLKPFEFPTAYSGVVWVPRMETNDILMAHLVPAHPVRK